MDKKDEYHFHQSVIVDEGAVIGKGTKIWHWTHICKGAVIGINCSIGQNVFVGNKAIIGNNVKVQNNVSLYDNVIIEDGVFCGPSMVFTNVFNPRSEISRKKEYRLTKVKKGATLGANCTIICGVVIGEYAFIGAGAVVNKEVKPYALMLGVPATQKGWMSAYGERINLSKDGQWNCEKTGDIYRLKDENMTRKIGSYWTTDKNENN
tara:strand:+ start:1025 stop:1645 length:621 start_codon:yes stop_codon:yes gene_type:complete